MEVGVQMYKNKVVVVTGDGHGIGLATRKAFEAAGGRYRSTGCSSKIC